MTILMKEDEKDGLGLVTLTAATITKKNKNEMTIAIEVTVDVCIHNEVKALIKAKDLVRHEKASIASY